MAQSGAHPLIDLCFSFALITQQPKDGAWAGLILAHSLQPRASGFQSKTRDQNRLEWSPVCANLFKCVTKAL